MSPAKGFSSSFFATFASLLILLPPLSTAAVGSTVDGRSDASASSSFSQDERLLISRDDKDFGSISWTVTGIHASSKIAKPGDPFTLRISCGARLDTRTPSNTLWYRDFAYTGGRIANATVTSDITPSLKTLRYFPLSDGPENCYNIYNIHQGHYQVRLFLAVIAETKDENEPLFDISVEGTLIYSMDTGWSAVDGLPFVEAIVFIAGSSISFCFHSTGHGDPSILSIEILQIDDNAYNFGPPWGKGTMLRTAKRLTCGYGKPAFDQDYDSNHWGGNRYWAPIKTFEEESDEAISTEDSIDISSEAPNFYPEQIYQSAIVGTDRKPDLSFHMEVEPNKNYSIWLHFAEIDPRIMTVGQRVFDILVNGDVAFKEVDIIQVTGKSNAALVLNKTIDVTGKTLTLFLHPINGSHAIINAIEVLEVITEESKTSYQEVSALQILKSALGLPSRFGWNGDPCVPQQHPWNGIHCQYDSHGRKWVIDGLGLGNQGLKGFLPDEISQLSHLQSINLSWNSIHGTTPHSIGTIPKLQSLDLSFNVLNGSIPESLGHLTMLYTLNLNGNKLSGRVPSALGGRPLHRASFNFTDNDGLCGIPGLPSCGGHLPIGAKIGIVSGSSVALLLALVCATCCWKRRQNILRAQMLATSREAPYAKARTQFTRDVQMTKFSGERNQEPRLLT